MPGCCTQQKYIFSQFCRLEVQDQGVGMFGFFEASLLDLQMTAFPLDLVEASLSLCWLCSCYIMRTPVMLG